MKRILSKLIFASFLFSCLYILGCSDDDEESTPAIEPVASFTFTAEELSVTFNNTSTDGLSFSWDFGDNNTSTDRNPTHTYAAAGTYTVSLTATNAQGSNQASQSVTVALNPENVRLTSGFVVVGTTDEGSSFAQYFEELPTGTIDISQGTAFQGFFPLSVIDGAMFMTRTDGSSGFAKIGVNGNQEFVEDGIISTISDASFQIAARDSEFGVFHDRNDPDVINIFNPSTMQVTGSIDMTVANAVVEEPVRYQDFIFRGDNEIFVPMRTEAGAGIPNMAMGKVDIAAGRVTEVSEFEGLGDVIFLNTTRRHVDEDGNLYIFHSGNISVPTISAAVLKIPAESTDYDNEYQFKIPEVHSPAVIGAGSFMGLIEYWKDDMGIALVNESLDPRIFELITERGGIQNLTPEDFQQVQFWLFTSPTGVFVQVDLENQTSTAIPGLPLVSVFDNLGILFIDNVPHFAISNPTDNSFYRFNEATGSAEKLFDVTGASIAQVIDLSSTVR